MIDTLLYAKKLEEVGFSREQAEAHMQIYSQIVTDTLATKDDLRHVEKRLDAKIERMIQKLDSKLDRSVHILEARIERIETKLDGLETRLVLKLGVLMGGMFTLATSIIAILLSTK